MSTLAVDGITNGDGSGAPAFPNGVSGNIITTGNLTAANLTLSGGAYLGGTGSANLLDDYEEGTWTPVLTNWTNVGTPTVTGNYTITGNLVYVEIKIIPATSVSATGGNASTTLPISPANSVVCVWANGSNGAGLGTALVSTTDLWVPVISSTANTLVASATYRTA